MINVDSAKEREAVRNRLLRIEAQLAVSLRVGVKKIILNHFSEAARLIEHGVQTVSSVVDDGPLKSVLKSKFRQTADVFSKLLFKEAGLKCVHGRELKAAHVDRFWRAADVHIAAQTAEQVVKINSVTKKVIKKIVEVGALAGDSNRVIAARLLTSGRIHSGFRAVRIATTEVHSLSMYSLNESAQATDLLATKTWVTSLDARTRDWHASANGETVPLDGTFEETGESMDYPGDMAGSAENVINCRCTVVYNEE